MFADTEGRTGKDKMKIARYLRTLLLAATVLAVPAASFAGVFISIGIAPPPLPVYEQPAIPADGYMWTPGYWAWSDYGGYYWVPGTWVQPPQVGVLWTPGYWGWNNGAYIYNAGYWGPHIGFYGGVNYGYGYGGSGYEGGYWNNGHFAYNRSVNNVSNVHITNVYNKTVINNTTINRTSFNGGSGGIQARPTAQEQAAVRENHIQPTAAQVQHVNQAQSNPQLRASENGGRPAIAATSRPADFKSAVPAREAGGRVDTAAYKAAASNGGKLPPNMKDPGGNTPANRAANNAEARPSTSNNHATEARPTVASNSERPAPNARPAAISPTKPAAPAAKPAAPATRPATETPRPEARPETTRPETESRPAAQPKPVAQPKVQTQAKAQPRPQSEPRPQAQPKPVAQSHPQQPHPQPKQNAHEGENKQK